MGKSSKDTPKDSKSNDAENAKLKEQLNKAELAVLKSLDATIQLHKWWRVHLLRISCLVSFIAFYQSQAPSRECILNIKAANDAGSTISGSEAFFIVIYDCAPEFLSIIMSASLTACLSSAEEIKLTNKLYVLSTVLVPFVVSTFLNNRKMGCVRVWEDAEPSADRQFPAALVYFTIASLSLMFMRVQLISRRNDVRAVKDLIRRVEKTVGGKKKK